MNSGELRHRIYILDFADSKTVKGDRVRNFEKIPPSPDIEPDDWAAITPLRGRELVIAMGIRAELTHKIKMRYRNDVQPGKLIGWVENEDPMIYRVFELGPALDDELRGTEMWFYGIEIL